MRTLITKKMLGLKWKLKISLILSFTVLFSGVFHGGWYDPGDVYAATLTVTDGTNPSNFSAAPGATNQYLNAFALAKSGTGATPTAASVTVTITGTASNISAIYLKDSTGVTTYGTVNSPGSTVTFSPLTLATGTYTIYADVASGATSGTILAAVTSGVDSSSVAFSSVTDTSATLTIAGDTIPPTVSSTTPADGATGITVNSSLVVVFSENVSCPSALSSNITMSGATIGTPTCSAPTNTITYPISGQAGSTTYSYTIGGVKDVAGNTMATTATRTYTTAVSAGNPNAVSATSAAIASAATESTSNVVMQRLTLNSDTVSGSDNKVILSSLTMDDAGTAAKIATVKLYISSISSPSLPNYAVLLGGRSSWDGVSATFALTGGSTTDRTVTSGTPKYLYIVYDMAFGQSGTTVQSHVTNVGVSSPDASATVNLSSTLFTLTAGSSSGIVTSCTSCHAYPPADASGNRGTPATAVVGSHSKHSTGTTCSACHVAPATQTSADFGHRNGNIQFIAGVGYSRGTSFAQNNDLTGASLGTCSTASCHDPYGTTGISTPKWGTAATCSSCHTGTGAFSSYSGPSTGSHSKHGEYKKYLSTSCGSCHPGAVAGSNGGTSHLDGNIDVSGSGFTGYAANVTKHTSGSGYSTCTASSCHTTGRGTGMGTSQSTVTTWGAASSCLNCHGGRNGATGDPARSVANFTLTTTHSQHLKYPAANINCQICHAKTVTDAATLKQYTGVKRHVNGTRDVYFTNLAYASYTSYKTSGANANKCLNTSCHGGTTRSVWSASAQNTDHTCSHCHGTAGTASTTQVTGTNRYNLRFFAPGYKKTGTVGTSTDQNIASNDKRVGSHFKHLSSAYMRNIKCNECHKVPSTPFSADTNHSLNTLRYNSATLDFSQSSSARILIGVASGSTTAQLAAFNGYTNGTAGKAATCSSVYCHGNRLKTGDTSGSYRKPYWNYSAMINYTDKVNACGRCHGNPPTTGTAATTHNAYVSQPTTSCSGCHSMVVNASGVIINKDLHINGQVNASGGHEYGFAGYKHMPGGTGTITVTSNADLSKCTGCHSATSGGTYPVSARGVAANLVCTTCHKNNPNFYTTGSIGCGDCHGTDLNGGQPNGAYSAFPNWSGSHSSHIAQTYVCADCHNNKGTGKAGHGNYSGILKARADVAIAFNTTKSGTAATYASGTMQCSTSTCHGQKSPAWGSAVPAPQCVRCHGYQSLATLSNYTQNSIAPGTGNIDTGRVTGITARGGMHQEHLKGSTNISRKVRCVECHVSTTAVNHASLDNMTTAAVTFSGVASALSHTPSVTRTSGIINCSNTECHHGGNRADGTAAGQSGFATRPALAWNNSSLLDNSTVSGTCSQKCHYLPPGGGVVGDTHESRPAVTTFAGLTGCSSQTGGTGCHPSISGTTASTIAGIFYDKNLHINGIVEGGSCTSCHNQAQSTYRRQVVSKAGAASEFSVTGTLANMTSHVKTTNVSEKTCEVCHAQSSHKTYTDGVQVKLWNTRAASGTGTIVYDGTARSLNGFCTGCHRTGGFANIANMRPSGSTATATAPYADSSDSTAPDDIFTNWSAAAITSDGLPSTTRSTHQGVVNCMDCHGDNQNNSTTTPRINAHASKNGRFLRYSTTTKLGYGQTCFNKSTGCHGPGSTLAYAGARIYSQFKVNNASAGSGGAHPILQAETPLSSRISTDTAGAAFVNGWKSNSIATCSDCHGSPLMAGPRGPHGSSQPYLLKALQSSAAGGSVAYPTTHTNGTPLSTTGLTLTNAAAFCLNCHAADVYGDGNGALGSNAGTRNGHGSSNGNNSACLTPTGNLMGTGCQNCHCGKGSTNGTGGTHSTTAGKATTMSNFGFTNGNCWTGTPNTTSGCYATASATTWSSCTKGTHIKSDSGFKRNIQNLLNPLRMLFATDSSRYSGDESIPLLIESVKTQQQAIELQKSEIEQIKAMLRKFDQ